MSKPENNNLSIIGQLSLIIAPIALVVGLLFYSFNAQANSIIDTTVEPSQATTGDVVSVTAKLSDSNLIPTNLELQRVDDGGNVIKSLGALNKSENGVFTTQIVITETSPGLINFRILASVENFYKPIFSDVFTLEIIQ